MRNERIALSVAISLSYLSAVADRFGLWGKTGESGVAWGNYKNFLDYTKHLNSWAPDSIIPILGGAATGLEIILAILLICNYERRFVATISGVLLSSFAVAMVLADGIKGPFDYGVYTAIAASFLLAKIKDDGQMEKASI